VIPKILNQIWLGGNIHPDVYTWMQTTWKVNPEFEYRLWHEDRFRAEGIDIHQFDDQNDRHAGRSGGLRLVILERYGGIYLDCDVECLKPLDSLLGLHAFAAYQGDGHIANSVMGAEPGNEWIRWMIDHAYECTDKDPAWSTRMMSRAPLGDTTILPSETFYPWLWNTPEDLRKVKENTLAIHHWKGSW
jgi:mannosyltransferase OCH1-like enzyme